MLSIAIALATWAAALAVVCLLGVLWVRSEQGPAVYRCLGCRSWRQGDEERWLAPPVPRDALAIPTTCPTCTGRTP